MTQRGRGAEVNREQGGEPTQGSQKLTVEEPKANGSTSRNEEQRGHVESTWRVREKKGQRVTKHFVKSEADGAYGGPLTEIGSS